LPPPQLAPENYRELNEMFYRAEPHEYFESRVELLALAAAKPDLIFEAFLDGIEYKGLRLGGEGTTRNPDEEARERQHTAFVVAESVTLLHHVSETLVRFFFAHAPGSNGTMSPCPWLEIASELSHVEFKRKIERRFDEVPLNDVRRAQISTVFYGSASPQAANAAEAARLAASVENIEFWLHHLAHWFLRESNLFNALKHGLAVQPGESSMQLITPTDEQLLSDPPLIHAEGPSVSFLEKSGEPKLWHHSTRWVSPERLIIETQFAIWLLRTIWQVGRVRYTTLVADAEALRFYDRPSFEEYMKTQLGDQTSKIITNRMSMNLDYLYAYPPGLECAECGRSPRPEELAHKTWRGLMSDDAPLRVFCAECAERARGA
jgi:hypothetical protein